jgi:hypothetical protein
VVFSAAATSTVFLREVAGEVAGFAMMQDGVANREKLPHNSMHNPFCNKTLGTQTDGKARI